MSNVASRTYKKRGFCSCGAQFAPPIAFEMHRWHLPFRLGVTTGKTTTSDPKAFPKRLAPERGNSVAWRAQGHRFSTCVWMIFNVKRCVQNLLKKRIIQLWGSICTSNCLRNAPLAPSVAFGRHDGQNHDFWPKSLPKKARPGTGKQHGLASSRTPFFDLRWNDLQCQTSRPEPIKKEDFAAVGLNWHLQLPSTCTVDTFRCVWASRRAKPRLLTQKPKAFPKRLAPAERGNSMAWRAQGHRFSTCVGMIFNVKRCVQNL